MFEFIPNHQEGFVKNVAIDETYQYTSKTGDIVLIPNGTVGIITCAKIVCGGNIKLVTIHPFTNWLHRAWMIITDQTWYAENQINRLKPLTLASR